MLGLARQFLSTRSPALVLVRTLKTHKGAAKRWWKNGHGVFLRKQAGRRHGNVGWSKHRVLNHLNGVVPAANTARHKRLSKLLPYM